jgi:predicted membrane protein
MLILIIKNMKNKTKIFLGILLLLTGALILLNNVGFLAPYGITLSTFWTFFWPALFLGIGITLIFDKNFTPGVIFSLVGLAMLASRLLNWNFWSTFWPLILIGIGLSIILRKDKEVSLNSAAKVSNDDTLDDNVLFWGVEKKLTSKNFKGGEINTIFGGYQLDLRDTKIAKDGAELNVNCAFGGVEIFVPKNCRVVTNGTGILGGWTPNIEPSSVDEPLLTIKGVAAFGGVEIKN